MAFISLQKLHSHKSNCFTLKIVFQPLLSLIYISTLKIVS